MILVLHVILSSFLSCSLLDPSKFSCWECSMCPEGIFTKVHVSCCFRTSFKHCSKFSPKFNFSVWLVWESEGKIAEEIFQGSHNPLNRVVTLPGECRQGLITSHYSVAENKTGQTQMTKYSSCGKCIASRTLMDLNYLYTSRIHKEAPTVLVFFIIR